MALFSLLYNLYLLRLSYQEDFIGQVASMAPLATGLLALPTGILSDRLGRRPFLIASGLLLAISQLGLCLTTSSGALLAFSFVGGVAMAFVWVNHVPFLSDNAHPARRAEALAIWSALQIIVRMLLSLVGGFMPGVMGYFLGLSTEVPEPFRYALFFGAGVFAHRRRAAVVRIRFKPVAKEILPQPGVALSSTIRLISPKPKSRQTRTSQRPRRGASLPPLPPSAARAASPWG